ncbi:MAG: hypothetical protein GX601_04925, partial [Anaerolineales bacterium]|nr:hypothetical protein [Anaerolineales bacterium]
MQKPLRAGLGIVMAVAILLGGSVAAYALAYRDRIYSGVAVAGVDVSGLTVDAAIARLREQLFAPAEQGLDVRAGEHLWRLTWANVGQVYDHAAMASAAYDVGRTGTWPERIATVWRARRSGCALPPLVVPAAPAQVKGILDRVAPLVFVA